MRFPKTLTFSCLLVVGAAVGYTQTAEQQEKALRSLRQFIAEKETAPSSAPKAQTPAPVAQPAPAEEDKVKAAQQALENLRGSGQTGQASPSSLAEEKERKARAALDELRRSGARPAAPLTATTSGAATTSPLTDTLEQKARTALSQAYTGTTPGAELPSDAESRARAALEQLRNQTTAVAAVPTTEAQQPATSAFPTTVAATPAPAAAQPTAVATSQPVAETPAPAATPVAVTKKDKLQEILELYVADQITPREYHDRRARILAGN